MSTYGSSSKIVKPYSRASSISSPALQRQRHAGRVLEVRDHVRELRAYARLQQLAQLVDVETVLVERHLVDLGAHGAAG